MQLIADRFLWIEKRGSVTASELAEKFWISRNTAAVWLSRMANFRREGTVKRYLVYEKTEGAISTRREGRRVRAEGSYKIGPDWWGELFYEYAKYDIYG